MAGREARINIFNFPAFIPFTAVVRFVDELHKIDSVGGELGSEGLGE